MTPRDWKYWWIIAIAAGVALGLILPPIHPGRCDSCDDAGITAAITYSIISGSP